MKIYSPDREYPPEYREVLEELKKIIDPVTGEIYLTQVLLRAWRLLLSFESLAL